MLINAHGFDVSFTFPAALDDTRWAMHVVAESGEKHLLDGTRYPRLEQAHDQALRFGLMYVPRAPLQVGMRPVARP